MGWRPLRRRDGPHDLRMIGRFAEKTSSANISRSELLCIGALLGGFIGVVLWFRFVDFYHRFFFQSGAIVLADNLVRVVFVAILAWLIYAPGAGIAALLLAPGERTALTPAERSVLGFGIGVGIWHVVLLILGVLGLYYRSVMAGLCLVVLVVSARHFGYIAVAGWHAIALPLAEIRQRYAQPQAIGALLIAAVAAWLLLLRALYPGGGGDYYTHYFYYYLAVLHSHGLGPNDVWYHYFYSKGSGLAFLGMLLTDPEAPALTTFPCVVFAGLAMATLAARMAPRSLWPAAGALIYLLFYLFSFSASGEGQFQKDHEEIAALVVLTTWALCMERCGQSRLFLLMAAATAVAAAIVTQAIGILLGVFVGMLCIWAMLRRQWSQMWGYGLVGAAVGGAVVGMLVLSYLTTGLASDQALDLMLHFADFTRLDGWGVIPQVIAIAWIRDNYQALALPVGVQTLVQLAGFMRLGILWPFLLGPVIAVAILKAAGAFAGWRLSAPRDPLAASFSIATLTRLAALVGFLAVVAFAAGRGQSVSFGRLSTFFVPLLVLLGIAGSVWALNWPLGRGASMLLRLALPAALFIGVLTAWEKAENWTAPLGPATANALRFFTGRISLSEAYAHANSPYAFGAINPGALAAARQVPPGTPIWSTNVDSYCMVPDCLIESVISFKMSGRLDEILGGDPELARQLLQEAGLNFFLFMRDYQLIDLLPYSRLFAPETIGRYLGVKWSDGSNYLLTWTGPDTRPIGPDFLGPYTRRRDEPDGSRWFRFADLAPQIAAIAPRMRSSAKGWGMADSLLVWRHLPPGSTEVKVKPVPEPTVGLNIRSATYGGNCGAPQGNVTRDLALSCNGKPDCAYRVDVERLGDPVPKCGKDFAASYSCAPDATILRKDLSGEAGFGSILDLSCAPGSGER